MTDATQRSRSAATLGVPLLAAIGAIAMLGPFATDAFLPALPAISTDLGAAAAQVQLSLTGVTVGIAVGQLVTGPLSDGIGRRLPLLLGAGLMAVAAAGAAAAPTLPVLVVCCTFVGLGASFGMVVGRAVLSDLATGPVLTRAFALLGTLIGLGPVLSPIFGVAVMSAWGWRSIFLALGLLCAGAFTGVALFVPESHPPHLRIARAIRSLPRNSRRAFRSRRYLAGATIIWFGFGAQFGYIAGSSLVLQGVLGLSPLAYSIVFGVNGGGLILAGLVGARLARTWSDRAVMALGLGVQAVGALVILVTALTGSVTVWTMLPAAFLVAASMGLVFGPATSYALHDLRDIAGTALAVVGAVQFVGAGIVSPLVALGGSRDPVPFALVIAASSALAWTGWLIFTTPAAAPVAAATTPDRERRSSL